MRLDFSSTSILLGTTHSQRFVGSTARWFCIPQKRASFSAAENDAPDRVVSRQSAGGPGRSLQPEKMCRLVWARPDNKRGLLLGQLIARCKTHIAAMIGSHYRSDAEAMPAPH